MSLQNTTSKPRRGYCSTRTEARADDFTLTCSGHKNSSQHALLGAESWFGRNSSQSAPWTGQSSVKCLLITIRSQGAGLGLPWKGNPDTLAEYARQRPSLPHTPREQSVGAIQFQHFLAQNDSSAPVSPFAPAQHGVGVDGTFHTSLGPKRDCGITIYKHQVEHKAAISPEALESEPGFGCSDFCLPHYSGNIF